MQEKKLSHIDPKGNPAMVDVSAKQKTFRRALARISLTLPEEVMQALRDGEIHGPKGPVLQTALIAGTQAVKRTSEWIPFCHPLPIEGIRFRFEGPSGGLLSIFCEVSTEARTGVEMEALTGCSAAALTVYDMCKALSPAIVIGELKLLEKQGGKMDYRAL